MQVKSEVPLAMKIEAGKDVSLAAGLLQVKEEIMEDIKEEKDTKVQATRYAINPSAKWMMPSPEDTVQLHTAVAVQEETTVPEHVTGITTNDADITNLEHALVSGGVKDVEESEPDSVSEANVDVEDEAEAGSDDDAARAHIQAAVVYVALHDLPIHASPCLDADTRGTITSGTKCSIDGLCRATPGVWARLVNGKGTSVRGWLLVSEYDGLRVHMHKKGPEDNDAEKRERMNLAQPFVKRHALNTVVTSALLELTLEQQEKVQQESGELEDWENKNALIMHKVRVAAGEELSRAEVERRLAESADLGKAASSPKRPSAFGRAAIAAMNKVRTLLKEGDRDALVAYCKASLPPLLQKLLNERQEDSAVALEECRRRVSDATGLTGKKLDSQVVQRLYALCLWMVTAQADAADSHSHVSPLMRNWSRQTRRSLREREKKPTKQECPLCAAKMREDKFDDHFAACKEVQPDEAKARTTAHHRALLHKMVESLCSQRGEVPTTSNFAGFDGTWKSVFEGDGDSESCWLFERPQVGFRHPEVGENYRIGSLRWKGTTEVSFRLQIKNPPAGWSSLYLLSIATSSRHNVLVGVQMDVDAGEESKFELHRTGELKVNPHVVLRASLCKDTFNDSGIECRGAYVKHVRSCSPAEEVEIRRGCRIISIDGRDVSNADDVNEILRNAPEVVDITFAPPPARVRKIINSSAEVRAAAGKSRSLTHPADRRVLSALGPSREEACSPVPMFVPENGDLLRLPLRSSSTQSAASEEVLAAAATVTCSALRKDCAWSLQEWRKVYDNLKLVAKGSVLVPANACDAATRELQGHWAMGGESLVIEDRRLLRNGDTDALTGEGDQVTCRDMPLARKGCTLLWGEQVWQLKTAIVTAEATTLPDAVGRGVEVVSCDSSTAEVVFEGEKHEIAVAFLAANIGGFRVGQKVRANERYGTVVRFAEGGAFVESGGEERLCLVGGLQVTSAAPTQPLVGLFRDTLASQEDVFCEDCGCYAVMPGLCNVCRLWDRYSEKPYREIREECKRLNLRSCGTTENLCRSLLQYNIDTAVLHTHQSAVAAAVALLAVSLHLTSDPDTAAYLDTPIHPVALHIIERVRAKVPSVVADDLGFLDDAHPSHDDFCRRVVESLLAWHGEDADSGIQGWWVYGVRNAYCIEKREDFLHFRQPGLRVAGFMRQVEESKMRPPNMPPPDFPLSSWVLETDGARLWIVLDDDGRHVRSCFVNEGAMFSEVAARISERGSALSKPDIAAFFNVDLTQIKGTSKRSAGRDDDEDGPPRKRARVATQDESNTSPRLDTTLKFPVRTDEDAAKEGDGEGEGKTATAPTHPTVDIPDGELASMTDVVSPDVQTGVQEDSPAPVEVAEVVVEREVVPEPEEPMAVEVEEVAVAVTPVEVVAPMEVVAEAPEVAVAEAEAETVQPTTPSNSVGDNDTVVPPKAGTNVFSNAAVSVQEMAAMVEQLQLTARGMKLLSIESMQQPTEKLTWPPDSGPVPLDETDRGCERGKWSSSISRYIDPPLTQFLHHHGEMYATLCYVAVWSWGKQNESPFSFSVETTSI